MSLYLGSQRITALGIGNKSIDIDDELSLESENPVQNKVLTATLNNKLNSSDYIIDSNLNSTSVNPVQNKVIYPSLSNYLPNGTTITVRSDEAGDFTDIQEAFNYLEYKWSNGQVTINIPQGSYHYNTTLLLRPYRFNIPILYITGNSSNKTLIQHTGTTAGKGVINIQTGYRTYIKFSNLYIDHLNGGRTLDYRGIIIDGPGMIHVENCKFQRCFGGINNYSGTDAYISGTLDFVDCNVGLNTAGRLGSAWGVKLNFTTCTTGLGVQGGGFMQLNHAIATFNSVNNKTNVQVNTMSANGIIMTSDSTGF